MCKAAQELNDHERYDVITAIQIHHYLTQRDREEAVFAKMEGISAAEWDKYGRG